ncbi:MAG: hypothetical protein IKL96_10830 [Kiritimatiellae bacterium]|nr:hypothetical protein [Kiritimatiellia bacterium]
MKNITLTRNGQTAPRDVEVSTMHADGLVVGQGVMLRIKGDCCYGGPTPYKQYVVTKIVKSDRFDGKCSDVTFTVAAKAKKPPTTNKPTTNKPTANVPAAVPVAATRDRDAAYRLSRQYAKVNGSWKNALEQTVRFGAMLKEWGDFLGDTQGRDGEGLRSWLAQNCPEINYQTAMGYKHLAEKTVRMLGGGAGAVAALLGRDTVTDPDGNEVPIDAEVVERKEAIFRAADSRRKLEQMYFDFTDAPAKPKGRAKGSKNVPRTDAERADAFWKLNAAALAAPWALKSIPLVEWRVANFALSALQPLVTALKRRVAEGE